MGTKIITELFGSLFGNAEGIIDELVTTKEEKLNLKNKFKSLLLESEAQAQEQVTKRWEADAKSDNTLTKSIRPVIIIFLSLIFVIISFLDGNVGEFSINPAYIPVYQGLLLAVYGAYFVGRTIEKKSRI
jgi:hypothetical protein